jgi:hypothetical protein
LKIRKSVGGDLIDLNLSSIFRLFTATFALVTTSTLAIQFLRQGDHPSSEFWDDGIYLLALLVALLISFEILRTNRIGQSHWVLTACALVGIVLGIVSLDHPLGSNQLWNGFGWWPLVIAILLTPWVWRLINFQSLNTPTKYLVRVIVIISSLFSLLSVYQGKNSLIYSYPSSFMINESLSVAAGHWPYVDFIPQYQIGYSFFLSLFKSFLNADQLVELCLVFMSLILIATLVLSVIIVRACLPNRSIFIATALVVPFTCVVPFPGRIGYRGSIAEFLSAIPVRIFPGVVIIGLICWSVLQSNKSVAGLKNAMTCVGLACGLVLWHTQDFGIALVASIYLGLMLLKFLSILKTKFIVIYWTIGVLFGFVIYPVASLALGKQVNISDYGFFLRQFGGGYGSEPIHTPGPVLLILPMIIAVLVCCIWILRLSNRFPNSERRGLQFPGAVGLFFSLWTIASFPYYVNRSFAADMLQTFLLPVSIALGALVGAILTLEKLVRKVGGEFSVFTGLRFFQRQGLLLVPLSLSVSLVFASILLTPNPRVEFLRLAGMVPQTTWSVSNMQSSIDDSNAALFYANSTGASVGFIGLLGNYVQLESGLESVSIFNSPDDIVATAKTEAVFCQHLLGLGMDYLVLGERGPELLNYFPDHILCGRYAIAAISGVRAGHSMKAIN